MRGAVVYLLCSVFDFVFGGAVRAGSPIPGDAGLWRCRLLICCYLGGGVV